jgi:hypothetical protein
MTPTAFNADHWARWLELPPLPDDITPEWFRQHQTELILTGYRKALEVAHGLAQTFDEAPDAAEYVKLDELFDTARDKPANPR